MPMPDEGRAGRLVVVPTPIGNLEDITLRALRILGEVDLIACEDTRRTAKLLAHYDINTPTTSLHEHNERGKTPQLVRRILEGESMALVSDAGMPLISDPGFVLLRECRQNDVVVEVLPGPSSVTTALVASGLAVDRYCFEGYLPAKKGRRTRLEALRDEPRTMILFESPHRLPRTLKDLSESLGPGRRAAACRELTKKFEEVYCGTLGEVQSFFGDNTRIRGEFVLVIAGKK
jgi:16S rRNA (cytidine1402-2'-O)-methyltransferase